MLPGSGRSERPLWVEPGHCDPAGKRTLPPVARNPPQEGSEERPDSAFAASARRSPIVQRSLPHADASRSLPEREVQAPALPTQPSWQIVALLAPVFGFSRPQMDADARYQKGHATQQIAHSQSERDQDRSKQTTPHFGAASSSVRPKEAAYCVAPSADIGDWRNSGRLTAFGVNAMRLCGTEQIGLGLVSVLLEILHERRAARPDRGIVPR